MYKVAFLQSAILALLCLLGDSLAAAVAEVEVFVGPIKGTSSCSCALTSVRSPVRQYLMEDLRKNLVYMNINRKIVVFKECKKSKSWSKLVEGEARFVSCARGSNRVRAKYIASDVYRDSENGGKVVELFGEVLVTDGKKQQLLDLEGTCSCL